MNEQKSNPASDRPSTDASQGTTAASSPNSSPSNIEKSTAKPIKSNPETVSDSQPRETGGQKGLEPTRYGDWEKNGRCTDF